ncbi:MAG: HAMP domain-containing protein [Alphaproteobacteria bacterium]|nr:MAG: HAMP domain-containing protein [Alphaproteobacteria bacterium]
MGIVLVLLVVVVASYLIVTRTGSPESPLGPEVVAALVVANLVPAMALMVMIARRLAIWRAARSDVGGKGRLHVRLVALFSIIASIPTLLVVIFASMQFQSGLKFWFSDQAQTVLTSAENVSQIYAREHRERLDLDVHQMGLDVVDRINRFGLTSETFRDNFLYQSAARQITETAVLQIDPNGRVRSLIEVNFDNRPLTQRFTPQMLRSMHAGELRTASTPNRLETVVRLDPQAPVYLYGARAVNEAAIAQIREAQNAASAYQSALENTRRLQIRFNVILILGSLALIGLSIGIALALADRIVQPIGQLVQAARRVTKGDLSARVPVGDARDEVGTLGRTFNRMTRRLEEQTGALVTANAQLDMRRAFTEAVLSGVTAGVISVDDDHVVRLINSSAEALLRTGAKSPVGQKLADLVPELDRQLAAAEREDVVQVASTGEPRTLAVKTVKVKNGHVLTFDDITEQLMDQRRAAWSDVARRIAHEIKNPLTPIQLAAERLQRRYGTEIDSDPATFERLTGTIVRQVGDLRRMVDEFSSFARMPKPAFAPESLNEIARQALFLHEVAHPDIDFALDAPDPAPILVCDRRLLGQALTNVVKNGVEAIQQKREEKKRRQAGSDRISVSIREERSRVSIEVADTGIGLPAERARMTEPYMTTRAKGTGLGLAIVKKIVEEHFGQIEFEDAAGGGSLVRMTFDRETLAHLADNGPSPSEDVSASG